MAWAVLPVMDGLAKHLSTELPVLEVIWARYFFMVLITLPMAFIIFKEKFFMAKEYTNSIIKKYFFYFFLQFCFFYSISILSLAEALTLAFIHPIIATLLSSIILKEKVGLKRWGAVILGFSGALVFLRPGFNDIHLASLAGLGTGVAYAFYVITTKKLSSLDNPFLTLTFSGLVGAIIISLVVPLVWVAPTYEQWMIMLCLAAVGTLGHFFIILSLKYAEASKISSIGIF